MTMGTTRRACSAVMAERSHDIVQNRTLARHSAPGHATAACRLRPLSIRANVRHQARGRLLAATTESGTMPHVRYEWDNGKAAENLRKHGVQFTDAIAALRRHESFGRDRHAVPARRGADSSRRQGSRRRAIRERDLRDEDPCRIISVRKATRHELAWLRRCPAQPLTPEQLARRRRVSRVKVLRQRLGMKQADC
jgi:uncharacterized protein